MNQDTDQREIKRELRELNNKLSRIASRVRLIYFMTFLLPVLAAAGAGFYYAGGMDLLKRSYQKLIESKPPTERGDETDVPRQTDGEESNASASGDGTGTSPSGKSTSGSSEPGDPASTGDDSDEQDQGPAADWNPGGKKTEKAKQRREGFEEKSPVDND